MTRFPPNWLQQGSYAASVDRRVLGALWPSPASAGGAVSVASGMTVNIAAGLVAVPTANNTGTALCAWDAQEQVTLAAAPATGSNRWDLIVVQLRGNDIDGGANNDFIIAATTGTAAASPAVPATPNNAVKLADVYVPGASASVTAGNITDRRPWGLTLPRGELYGARAGADFVFATAWVTPPAFTYTFTVGTNRRIRTTWSAMLTKGAGDANAIATPSIEMDGASVSRNLNVNTANNVTTMNQATWNVLPGTHTTKLNLYNTAGNCTMGAQAQFSVDDVGAW